MIEIQVRPAQTADAPSLYQSWMAARQYYANHDARLVLAPISESEFAVGLRTTVERPDAQIFVAEAEGEVIGFVSMAVARNVPDRLPEVYLNLGYLYVDPRHRRAGVARQLVAALRTWANTLDGVAHVEMAVLEGDPDAAAFWEAMGFRPYLRRVWAALEDDA
jgi:GNAT superfamily N-acetyltransferase